MRRFTFSLLCMLFCMALPAQIRWCVVDSQKPEIPLAEMSNVGYLLANDYNDSLAVVCKDGTLYSGLLSISFRQLDVSAIEQPKVNTENMLHVSRAGQMLTLTGCPAGLSVRISDTRGHLLKSLKTGEQQTDIFIGDLRSGIYLLTVGETTLKFLRQ